MMSYGESKFDKTISYEDAISCRRLRHRRNAMANIFDGIDENLVRNLYRQHLAIEVEDLHDNSDDDDEQKQLENNNDVLDDNYNVFDEDEIPVIIVNRDVRLTSVSDESVKNNDIEMDEIGEEAIKIDNNNSNNNSIHPLESSYHDPIIDDLYMETFITSFPDSDCDIFPEHLISSRGCLYGSSGSLYESADCWSSDDDSRVLYDDIYIESDKPICTDRSETKSRRNGVANILECLTDSDIKHLHNVFSIQSAVLWN